LGMRNLAYGLALLLCAACGSSQLAQCQLGALSVLPTDPAQVTAGDLRDVVGRLRACEAPARPDGGSP
jgi:hypothetical protein